MALPYDQQEPIWDARDGLVQLGEATFLELARRLYGALPTSSHARRFTELVLEKLGERGRLDPYTDGARVAVLRSSPDEPPGWWIRHAPVTFYADVEYVAVPVANEVPAYPRPADAPADWEFGKSFRPEPPRPAIAPDEGRAVITLRAGDSVVELRYGDDGLLTGEPLFDFGDRWANLRWDALWPPTLDPRARPPQAPPPTWFLLLPPGLLTIEAFAELFLESLTASDPVRVRMRVDAPGGVEGCWERACRKLRMLAGAERLPTEGGFYLIDAFNGDPDPDAVACGPDLVEAERAWIEVERRLRPRPKPRPAPKPARPTTPPQVHETEVFDLDGSKTSVVTATHRFTIAALADIPWPIPGPTTTPVVAVRFPALRRDIPEAWRAAGFSRWRYLIGASGNVGFGLVRDEVDGVTEIGEQLVDVLDPGAVDAALASAAAIDWGPLSDLRFDDLPFETTCYDAWSNLHRAPRPPRVESASRGPEPAWADRCFDYHSARILRERRD